MSLSTEPIPQTVTIHATCRCRPLPVRLVKETVEVFKGLHLRRETPVLTYRCRDCKQIVTVTAGQMRL